MIKHLRFFMLNLLVLVSAAVMAQTTIDFTKRPSKRLDETCRHSCKTNLRRKDCHTVTERRFYFKSGNGRSGNRTCSNNNKK